MKQFGKIFRLTLLFVLLFSLAICFAIGVASSYNESIMENNTRYTQRGRTNHNYSYGYDEGDSYHGGAEAYYPLVMHHTMGM